MYFNGSLQDIEIVKYGTCLKICALALGWENKIHFILGAKFLDLDVLYDS